MVRRTLAREPRQHQARLDRGFPPGDAKPESRVCVAGETVSRNCRPAALTDNVNGDVQASDSDWRHPPPNQLAIALTTWPKCVQRPKWLAGGCLVFSVAPTVNHKHQHTLFDRCMIRINGTQQYFYINFPIIFSDPVQRVDSDPRMLRSTRDRRKHQLTKKE